MPTLAKSSIVLGLVVCLSPAPAAACAGCDEVLKLIPRDLICLQRLLPDLERDSKTSDPIFVQMNICDFGPDELREMGFSPKGVTEPRIVDPQNGEPASANDETKPASGASSGTGTYKPYTWMSRASILCLSGDLSFMFESRSDLTTIDLSGCKP